MKDILSRFSPFSAKKTSLYKPIYSYSPKRSGIIPRSFSTSYKPQNFSSYQPTHRYTTYHPPKDLFPHPLGNIFSSLSLYNPYNLYDTSKLYVELLKNTSTALPAAPTPLSPSVTTSSEPIIPKTDTEPVDPAPPKKKKKISKEPPPPPAVITTVNPDDVLPPMPEPVTTPAPLPPITVTAPPPPPIGTKETTISRLRKKTLEISTLPKREQKIYEFFLSINRNFSSLAEEKSIIKEYLDNPQKITAYSSNIEKIKKKLTALGIDITDKSSSELADIYIEKFGSASKQTDIGSSRAYSATALAIKYGHNPNPLSQKLTTQLELAAHLAFFQDNYDTHKSHEKFLKKSIHTALDKDGSFILPISILDKSVTTAHSSHAVFAIVTKKHTGELEFHLQDTSGAVKGVSALINGSNMKKKIDNLFHILRGDCDYNEAYLSDTKKLLETMVYSNKTKKTSDIFNTITENGKYLSTPQIWGNCHFSGLTHSISCLAEINQDRINSKNTPYIEDLTPKTLNHQVRKINELELLAKAIKKMRENPIPSLQKNLQNLQIRRTIQHSRDVNSLALNLSQLLKISRSNSLRVTSDILKEISNLYKLPYPITKTEMHHEIRKILFKKNALAKSKLSPFDIYVLTGQLTTINDNCFSECKKTYIRGGLITMLHAIADGCYQEADKLEKSPPNSTNKIIWGNYEMGIDTHKKEISFIPKK